MKTTAIFLAAAFALSGCLSASQATRHPKKGRHQATRSANAPTPRGMSSWQGAPSTAVKRPCPLRGMGTSNWFGTDNDANVYRDRPDCL
jgi:hypothetical protein